MALVDAKEKVCQLENAIKKLDLIKKHLSRNASDIKGEIHSCVSHNLEFLRDREVCLLSKVEEVLSQKEEALQQQQAQLNQALGVLQTRMALVTTTDSALDKQMVEILNKFNEMELSPGETPHIAFRADHVSLKQCILNYGRVDANALPLPSAFDDSKKPSVSLPRHVEEYEDADHHIFYKTVEELQKNDSDKKSINVTIPKLSTRMEDWLQKRSIPQEERMFTPLTSSATLSGCGSNAPSKSCCSTPGDINSLSSWLTQIKHHADLEEEHDFEIVDNTKEKNVVPTDLKQWLNSSPGYVENVVTHHKENQSLFQHIPTNSKFWLHQACQQMSSLESMKEKDLFDHISKESSTWLRSRAYSKQNTTESVDHKDGPTLFKGKDIGYWLVKKNKDKEMPGKNGNVNNSCCKPDIWLQSQAPLKPEKKATLSLPFQLEDICKANELCPTLLDCVCKPNCAIQCQELSGVKNPIDPTAVFNPVQLPMADWLHNYGGDEKMDVSHSDGDTVEKDCSDGIMETKNMFSHILDSGNEIWLSKPADCFSETSTDSPVTAFKQSKEEANMWLRQTQEISFVASHDECSKPTMNFNPSLKSLSDWLSTPHKLEIVSKDEEECMKEESEGWSLCSSPSSFNSEQFSKDVKVATSYLQDWVL